jgi:hypothetical protein
MTYKELQRKLQVQKLRYKHPEIFNQDKGGGRYDKYESLSFVLLDGLNNLYSNIRSHVIPYFDENEIAWWGDDTKVPTGHMLSSQMQCLNFLFALRSDKYAVLQIAQLFDHEIDDILPTIGDKDLGYIAFEFIYENAKLLNEDDEEAKRGKFCTSIDALIVAQRKGEKLLVPIEWKYTESYLEEKNKALEPRKGKTRQRRYNQLILDSTQLNTLQLLENSAYYYEPFYELMRQSLLVEQMVKSGIANDFLHILVVPLENTELLGNNYAFTDDDLQTTWRKCLSDQAKFKIIDSKQIRQLIENLPRHSDLAVYLKSRY